MSPKKSVIKNQYPSPVVITNVSPELREGRYRAKAAVGEEFIISADIFTHGHDDIGASIFIKQASDKKWQESLMTFVNNDHWEYTFVPEYTGIYEFRIQAWINHFSTWQKGLMKKQQAGQNINLELQIGASIVEKAAEQSNPKEKKFLKNYSSLLANEENLEKALFAANDENLKEFMACCYDPAALAEYPKTVSIEVEGRKAACSTWYELFPRSASAEPGKHGTFNDVKALLPRIAEMGFDTLYFPPIHPIGELKRKGKNNSLEAGPDDPGSPWAIGNKLGGHKAIHPQLGTLKDFQALIKAAKKLDMDIAMDIAFQCAPDHPYVKEHPQWFKWRPDGTVQYAENPPKRYEDILPFDFETEDREGLWTELKSVLDYWISKGITVFRVDNPHTKAFAFWEWAIAEIRKEHPEIIFLAEAFTRPRIMEQLAIAGFNQSYTYFTWRNTKKELETYLTELTKTNLRYYFRPNFWPNTPDILPPELSQGGENMHIIRLILAATLSSNYGLYGPVYEFGMTESVPGKEEYIDNEKYEIKHWDWNAETRIREVITLVNRIRRQNPALQTTWNIDFVETTNEKIICYIKRDERTANFLIIAVNLDPHNTQSANVKLPLEKLNLSPAETFVVRDLLSRDKYRWQGESNLVQLNPHEMPAHILRIEPQTN